MSFLREFLRDPVHIGAIAASGKQLAHIEVTAAQIEPHHLVVELGAGDGPMTREILRQRPQGKLLILEPNPALAASLRQEFPDADVAIAFAQALPELMAERGYDKIDRVVSSLPWAIWTQDVQNEIFDALFSVLAPDARFVTFAYVHALKLPAAKRLTALLNERFASVTTTPIAWKNLPPALVYVCEQPKL